MSNAENNGKAFDLSDLGKQDDSLPVNPSKMFPNGFPNVETIPFTVNPGKILGNSLGPAIGNGAGAGTKLMPKLGFYGISPSGIEKKGSTLKEIIIQGFQNGTITPISVVELVLSKPKKKKNTSWMHRTMDQMERIQPVSQEERSATLTAFLNFVSFIEGRESYGVDASDERVLRFRNPEVKLTSWMKMLAERLGLGEVTDEEATEFRRVRTTFTEPIRRRENTLESRSSFLQKASLVYVTQDQYSAEEIQIVLQVIDLLDAA